MEDVEEKIKEGYQKKFIPTEFHRFKLQGLKEQKSENNYDFWFKSLYEFFSSEQVNAERLLDVGSGPTVHNVGSASAYVPHIFLGEIVEASREHLRKWLRKDPDCIDWTPFIERVARAEGRKDLAPACKEIESRIRSAVKGVIHCDVLDNQVIAEEFRQTPYDVVLTSLTLETAATTWESYSKTLGRINGLLRPGGWLIMLGVTGCSYWQVGDNKFHCLRLEETDIQRALETNGFRDVRWKFREPDDSLPFDCKKLYFVTATKM